MGTLNDLLTSYKQVENPDVEITDFSYFTRSPFFKRAETSSETASSEQDIPEQTTGWQGWVYTRGQSTNNPTTTSINNPVQTPRTTPVTATTQTSVQASLPRTNTIRAIQTSNKQAYDKFVSDFDNYLKLNSQHAGDRDILTSIAALESAYKPAVSNKHSGALGYFQFLDSTRRVYNNSTREQFVNDTNQQFDAAVKHYRNIKRQLNKYQNEIKKSGLTDLQVAYGMWWRPASMIKYLKTGKDDYVNKSDGMTLEKILQRAS